jgi:hypothetical protein
MVCKVKLLYWSKFVIIVCDILHNVVDSKFEKMAVRDVTMDLSPVTLLNI